MILNMQRLMGTTSAASAALRAGLKTTISCFFSHLLYLLIFAGYLIVLKSIFLSYRNLSILAFCPPHLPHPSAAPVVEEVEGGFPLELFEEPVPSVDFRCAAIAIFCKTYFCVAFCFALVYTVGRLHVS
jgi:hypothetical protein